MLEDLWKNLCHNWVVSIVVLFWPVAIGALIAAFGRHRDGSAFGWQEAFYEAVASYVGAGASECGAKKSFVDWLTLSNRVFGLFAWAYIIAVVIVSLR